MELTRVVVVVQNAGNYLPDCVTFIPGASNVCVDHHEKYLFACHDCQNQGLDVQNVMVEFLTYALIMKK
jgi:hypothetical protein